MSASSSTISTVGGNALTRTFASGVCKGTAPIVWLQHGHALLTAFERVNL